MKHRQFKTECACRVVINRKELICKDLRAIKKSIYELGKRGEKYTVETFNKETGLITDVYLMLYTKEGPIFQRQTYSLWKDLKSQSEKQQYNMFIDE